MPFTRNLRAATLVSLALASFSAAAQYSSQPGDGYSLLPYTKHGYVGLGLGTTQFNTGCGTGGYDCDRRSDVGVHVFSGGLFNDWLGAEIGYLHTGKVDRAGGSTRAQGLNLSLLARVPIGAFHAFVKGGATYGETRVSSGLLSDVPAGKRRGWGGSYGAGLGYDFTPNAGVVLEWARHDMLFPGMGGRQAVELTSLAYVHRF